MALGSGMLMAFIPLYATERLGLASATVVRLDILTMVGGALSSLACGWLSDRAGSRPVVMPCAALLTLVSLGWVLLPRDTPYAAAFCGALYALFGVAYWGLTLGALRLLYNGVVPPSEDTAYMAIYYAWIGVAGGAGPLLAGGLLTLAGGRSEGVLGIPADGYTLVFAAALACLAVSWRQFGRVRPDGRHTTRSAMRGAMIWWAQR
jgi:MFS-type transporter involved in bile tolerance (Atg22 family)